MNRAFTIVCIAAIATAEYDLGQTRVKMGLNQIIADTKMQADPSPRSQTDTRKAKDPEDQKKQKKGKVQVRPDLEDPKEIGEAQSFVGLTQVGQAKQCNRTMDRAKLDLPDFYTILGAGNEWSDPEFTDIEAIYWSDAGETNETGGNPNGSWARAISFDNACLLGNTGPGADENDIEQGDLGDCWLLSAASSLAYLDDRASKLFVNDNNELPSSGIHAFNLYSLGVPATVVIDDTLPLDNNGGLVFANQGADGSMWGALLEKAFAKYWGNYSHIVGGQSSAAIMTMQGGPSATYYFDNDHTSDWVREYDAATSLEDSWKLIIDYGEKKQLMAMWTSGGDDSYTNANGLYYGHAYTLLGGVELASGTRLVKIRNPHGSESYSGPWSDTSEEWTDDLLNEANTLLGEAVPHVLDKGDGTFWMPFTDTEANLGGLYGQAKGLWTNVDVKGWHSDYFMRLNDDGTETSSYDLYYEGNSDHTLMIHSTVAQNVYVQGNLWNYRAYPQACQDEAKAEVNNGSRNYAVLSTNGQSAKAWSYGARDFDPIWMEAGETKTFWMELDLRHDGGALSTDWAVVAWAQDGAVYVWHGSGNLDSDQWPALKN